MPENNISAQSPFISYAQNFEDVMLWRALKHVQNGFYVDVGANDPVIDSVSKAFYDRGWRGVHFEPTPQYAGLLRQSRPDEAVLEIALGDADGVIDFNYLPNTGVNTVVDENAQFFTDEHGLESRRIQVAIQRMEHALRFLDGKEVHWLKIDVEGFEEQVLRGWNSKILRPWVIVIEATIPGSSQISFESWDPILADANYRFAYFDGLNRFYVAEEHKELLSAFATPPNVFDEVQLSGSANSTWCALVLSESEKLTNESIFQAAERERVFAEIFAERERVFAERERVLIEMNAKGAVREANLSNALEELALKHGVLKKNLQKGPFRSRQLIRHPKAFFRESFGLQPVRRQHRAPLLKDGFVDESGEVRLTLRWLLRQPTKAIGLLVRQPRKLLRYVVKHPRKFVRGVGIVSILENKNEVMDLSPEAGFIAAQLKRSIERNKDHENRH